jgi:hypothetical protein
MAGLWGSASLDPRLNHWSKEFDPFSLLTLTAEPLRDSAFFRNAEAVSNFALVKISSYCCQMYRSLSNCSSAKARSDTYWRPEPKFVVIAPWSAPKHSIGLRMLPAELIQWNEV